MRRWFPLSVAVAIGAMPGVGRAAVPDEAQQQQLEQEAEALRARVSALESELSQQTAQAERLQERTAAAEETLAQLQGERAAVQASQERRLSYLGEAIDWLADARRVLETGSDDVNGALAAAWSRFSVVADEAARLGSAAEADQAARAQEAVMGIRTALDRRDFQDAKEA